ncbi:MAG: PEGA domain-containing protein, partial [Candidatus Aureabacteria bacterium]|nr:PEGA domain-containing protein [Candidatus Auribacterota bacterium]
GKKTSSYKDEPVDCMVSKMFVADEGPGSDGQYYIQMALTPCSRLPEKDNESSSRKEDKNSVGYISIGCEPQGEVYLDGDFVGMTPIKKLKMTEGKHVIEIRKSGHKTWTKDIRVISDTHVPITVTLEKEPYIDENWK